MFPKLRAEGGRRAEKKRVGSEQERRTELAAASSKPPRRHAGLHRGGWRGDDVSGAEARAALVWAGRGAPLGKPDSQRHEEDLIPDREQAAAHVEERKARALDAVVPVLVRIVALKSAQDETAGEE